ncbi:MAG: hypothetical protein LAN71_11580 [Acidobacteriia bacterium]|nr:hypothetical protein [Terriglobia bacterium]
MDAGSVTPAIIEIEEAANGDGVVNGFVGPAGGLEGFDVLTGDVVGMQSEFLDKDQESLFLLGQGGSSKVAQNRVYQFLIAEEFRRTGGMGARSKRALVAAGGEGGN